MVNTRVQANGVAASERDNSPKRRAIQPVKPRSSAGERRSRHRNPVAAVKAAGLVDTLESKGPFTVFAPINHAFGKATRGHGRQLAGRTTFVIAHRLSTVRHADLVLVMQDGRIVERGTHDTLLEAGGLYAELHRRQFRDAP